jgi:hypothetical protein
MVPPILLKYAAKAEKITNSSPKFDLSNIEHKDDSTETWEVRTDRLQQFGTETPREEVAWDVIGKMKKLITGNVLQQKLYSTFERKERIKEK